MSDRETRRAERAGEGSLRDRVRVLRAKIASEPPPRAWHFGDSHPHSPVSINAKTGEWSWRAETGALELLAHCQDSAAATLLDWRVREWPGTPRFEGGIPWACCDCRWGEEGKVAHPFSCSARLDCWGDWLGKLEKFPLEVRVRAALALVEEAHPHWLEQNTCECGCTHAPGGLLVLFRNWVANPTEKSRLNIIRAWPIPNVHERQGIWDLLVTTLGGGSLVNVGVSAAKILAPEAWAWASGPENDMKKNREAHAARRQSRLTLRVRIQEALVKWVLK